MISIPQSEAFDPRQIRFPQAFEGAPVLRVEARESLFRKLILDELTGTS
jgi:hypothetical protein